MGPSQFATLVTSFVIVIFITLSSCATSTAKYEDKIFKSKPDSPVTASQLSEAVKEVDKSHPKPQAPSVPSSNLRRQFRADLSKRRPKFGMNFTIPGLTMASTDVDTFLGPTGLFGGTNTGLFGGINTDKTGNPNVLGDIATIAAPLILLKGVSVAAIKVLKTIILPPIFFLVLLAFLIAGAIYFASAIYTGKESMNLSGYGGTTYSRNTYDYEQPVHDALDNGYYKYNTYADNYNYNYDKSAAASNLADPEYTTYSYQPYTSRYSSYNNYIYPKTKDSVKRKGT